MLKTIAGIVAAIGGLVSVDLLYANYVERGREASINSAFAKGSAPPPDETSVVRKEELDNIKLLLTPTKSSKVYHLITGENGTGKTTLVLEACRDIGTGCVYVDVPDKVSGFGVALGAVIHFEFNEHISFTKALQHKIFGTEMAGLYFVTITTICYNTTL